MSWKVLSASVTGSSHVKQNTAGQDYCRAGTIAIGDREYFFGAAADGAGSTAWGGEGARIACETVYASVLELLRADPAIASVTDDAVRALVLAARAAISRDAAEHGREFREYASTLVCALVSADGALFFQVGDGGIVRSGEAGYETVFWPDQGEYANTTYFLTHEDVTDHLRIDRAGTPPARLALFTDGLQNLVLAFATRTVHAGFFDPLFAAMGVSPENQVASLSAHFDAFLNMDAINERTDDDRTLILALREPA